MGMKYRDRLALAFGLQPEDRASIVAEMLARHPKDTASYWLQLMLAMGIATLGLVLNSTGVVIGAMLIAPLMGPIVGLGMALAVGSPYLALRSAVRCAASIVAVIGGALALTSLLPFQEATPEIVARTAPTLLDLGVAIFCSLAASFTTMRAGSDTASAAAGTSIGISLVPPLCVVGFGLGAGDLSIAGGAALLFTANFCSIVLFAVLSFMAVGFDEVDTFALEGQAAPEQGATASLARWLRGSSRSSLALRIVMPLALVLAIFSPLRRALTEVSWQVRARAQVKEIVTRLSPTRTVTSELSVDRGQIVVRLLVVEDEGDASVLQQVLREQIAATTGTVPRVQVVAVPDQEALENAAQALAKQAAPAAPLPAPAPRVALATQRIVEALDRRWPTSAGALLAWSLTAPAEQAPTLQLEILGPGLGPAGESLLAEALRAELGEPLRVSSRAFSDAPRSAPATEGALGLGVVLDQLAALDQTTALYLCAALPAEPQPGAGRKAPPLPGADPAALALARQRLRAQPRASWREGAPAWQAALSATPCDTPTDAALLH